MNRLTSCNGDSTVDSSWTDNTLHLTNPEHNTVPCVCVCVNTSKCGQQSYINLFRIIKIKQSRFRPSTAILLITSGIRAEVKLPGVYWTAHHDVHLFIYLIFQLVEWFYFYNPTTDSKQTLKKERKKRSQSQSSADFSPSSCFFFCFF